MEDLTFDILRAKKMRKVDIFEFAKFVKDEEPDITLDEFLDRLSDELYHLTVDEWHSDNIRDRKYYCLVIEHENNETA
jgi:hypothetical protein